MKINMEEVKAAQKFMIEWCEQNDTKIMLTPDSALEIMQCMADYKGQELPIHSVSNPFNANEFEYSEFIKGKGKEYHYVSNKIHYFVNGELVKILNQ